MLVTMEPILKAAKKGRYCVAAPNFMNVVQMEKAVEAAEELNSPLILDINRLEGMPLNDFNNLAAMCAFRAEQSRVPIAINLDHGSKYEYIVQALFSKCSSVMCDRSYLPFEKNVEEVSEIVKIAHAIGKSVEAELGHVGTNDGADREGIAESHLVQSEEDKKATYTKVEEAIEYVERTHVDALAVAVGTVHGLYPKGFKPSIDFDLLKTLNEAVDVPLVLHGGSGNGEEILAKAAYLGCAKLNVGSDLFRGAKEGLDKAYAGGIPKKDVIDSYYEGYKEMLKYYIGFLGSKNKA